MPPRLTAQDIEISVAQHFNPRQNVIVPNVHWGLGLPYEADLVVLRPSGYAIEVEIKTTASDIRADLKKKHQHDSNLFRELWFAVPQELVATPEIPGRAGVLGITPFDTGAHNDKWFCQVHHAAKMNRAVRPWEPRQVKKLLELGVMRIWTLKQHLAVQRLHSKKV